MEKFNFCSTHSGLGSGLKPRDELVVERRGAEIILRRVSREDILKEFNEIKLFANEELRSLNAEHGKHKYGGYKE